MAKLGMKTLTNQKTLTVQFEDYIPRNQNLFSNTFFIVSDHNANEPKSTKIFTIVEFTFVWFFIKECQQSAVISVSGN